MVEDREIINDKIGVVILNYNDANDVISLTNTIKEYESINKIVIVDNCSTDNSLEVLSKINNTKVILLKTNKNGGYGYGNNFGIKYLKEVVGCKYAIIANPDVRFEEEVVIALKNVCKKYARCAVVSCHQNNLHVKKTDSAWKLPCSYWNWTLSKLKILSCFTKANTYSKKYLKKKVTKVDCVQGAFLLVDVDLFLSFGGYDEKIFLYCEEVNLAFDLKKHGLVTLYLHEYSYNHYHSQSIIKSFPKLRTQQKMILRSQKYIMNKTWDITSIDWIIINLIFKISELEFAAIGFLKQHYLKESMQSNGRNFG